MGVQEDEQNEETIFNNMKKRNQFKRVVAAVLIGGVFTLSCTGNRKKRNLWK